MADSTESIHAADVEQAAALADFHPMLSGRDLLHIAVMNRLGVTRIVSADSGFDRVSGIERLDPGRFSEWRESLSGF